MSSESLQPRRALVLLVAIALGIIAGVLVIPFAFRLIPNDLSRIATVLGALRDVPELVVFGDSRAQASIDAAQLSAELPGKPLAYNLSWHAQRLAHSFALMQELPPSTRVVVILVSLQDLEDRSSGLPRVWSAMRAYGYDVDRSTMSAMREAFGEAVPDALTMSRIEARLDARWGMRQFAETGLRSLLRRDLRLAREREDLFFPTAYTERVTPGQFESMLGVAPKVLRGRTLSDEKTRLVVRLGDIARRRRLRLILLVPATHPRLVVIDHDRSISELRAFAAQQGLEVVDGSRWLVDEDYVDPLHASITGARRFTSALSASMRGPS